MVDRKREAFRHHTYYRARRASELNVLPNHISASAGSAVQFFERGIFGYGRGVFVTRVLAVQRADEERQALESERSTTVARDSRTSCRIRLSVPRQHRP